MWATRRLSAAPAEAVWLAALAAALFPLMYGSHPGHGAGRVVAATVAAVAGLGFVVLAHAREPARVDGLRVALALASAAAATVHFAVLTEHVEESWLFGCFFAVAGAAQVVWALLVLSRASPRVLAAGAVGNAAIVALWAASRTVGLPLGPHAGEAEAMRIADVVATGFELCVVLGACAWLAWPRARAIPGRWLPLVLALALTAASLASLGGRDGHHGAVLGGATAATRAV